MQPFPTIYSGVQRARLEGVSYAYERREVKTTCQSNCIANITKLSLVVISVLLLGTLFFFIGHLTTRTVTVTQANPEVATVVEDVEVATVVEDVGTFNCPELDSERRSFPDLDYALKGYHILRGYPLETGHDPGFRLPVFFANYSRGGHSADCRYHVPHGLAITPDVSCITSFSSQIIQTKYELSKSLTASASVSGNVWGAKFSASAKYKEASSTVSSGESCYILSECNCRYYYSEIIPQTPPPFHPAFTDILHDLNSDPGNEELFYRFFDMYGTHVSSSMIFGASYVNQYKMTTRSLKTMSSNGINVAASASYDGIISIGAKASSSSKYEENSEEFSKNVETKQITKGALPPSGGGAAAWASTVKESPVPVSYKLISIEEIFTEAYMGNLGIDYNTLRGRINDIKHDYCGTLKDDGEVDSCAELAPGLELKDTRLYNYYDSIRASTAVCIDTCMSDVICTGISWDTTAANPWCYFYKVSVPVTAQGFINWQSTIFLSKIYETWTIENSEFRVKGAARLDTGVANSTDCHDLCEEDRICVAYSYSPCNCTGSDTNCKLFSESGITGMKQSSRLVNGKKVDTYFDTFYISRIKDRTYD